MQIKLYSKPACVQCTATKRVLDARGIEYHEIQLDSDEGEKLTGAFKLLGFFAAPIVTVSSPISMEIWAGFQPERISQLS